MDCSAVQFTDVSEVLATSIIRAMNNHPYNPTIKIATTQKTIIFTVNIFLELGSGISYMPVVMVISLWLGFFS
jgi:hypothetical protein